MNFNKVIFIEIVIICSFFGLGIFFIRNNQFLGSSNTVTLSLLNEVNLPLEKIKLRQDRVYYYNFIYNSYEPAILIIDIKFENSSTPGVLQIKCNGRNLAEIQSSPEINQTSINMVSFSGLDWVKPMKFNVLSFTSLNGFEGSFNCQIKMRGSR